MGAPRQITMAMARYWVACGVYDPLSFRTRPKLAGDLAELGLSAHDLGDGGRDDVVGSVGQISKCSIATRFTHRATEAIAGQGSVVDRGWPVGNPEICVVVLEGGDRFPGGFRFSGRDGRILTNRACV